MSEKGSIMKTPKGTVDFGGMTPEDFKEVEGRWWEIDAIFRVDGRFRVFAPTEEEARRKGETMRPDSSQVELLNSEIEICSVREDGE